MGAMSKQGNALLRYLWCEAAMHAVERDPELKRFYRRKLVQEGLGKARVAAARKLTRPSRFTASARYPSSFNSYCQASPSGNFFTAIASPLDWCNSSPFVTNCERFSTATLGF
jgi:hypothetical protein